MLDPATAPLAALDHELARLVRRFRVGSRVVARGTRPGEIDDDTQRARWARRMEDADQPRPQDVERVPLRTQQQRTPPR